MTTATSSNAAAAALLGAILGDAAAQTSHWNYDVAADLTHGRRRWLVVEHSADETEESGDDVNDDDDDVNEEDEMTVIKNTAPISAHGVDRTTLGGGGDESSGSNITMNAAKFSRKNSMEEEMVVLIPPSAHTNSNSRKGKVPKSPAPLELLV